MSGSDLKGRIKESIVKSLRLRIAPEEIEDDVTLFRSGLGLDSIDALELILELERSYGLVIADEEAGREVLRSVNTIAAAIESLGSVEEGQSA